MAPWQELLLKWVNVTEKRIEDGGKCKFKNETAFVKNVSGLTEMSHTQYKPSKS